MADAFAECHVGGKLKRFNIIFAGKKRTFTVSADRIEAQTLAVLSPTLRDLLEVASAVFAADSEFTRGGDTRSNMGEAWTRDISFTLPVRCPEVWNKPEVGRALVDAVELLTGDRVAFTFVAKENEVPLADFLPFNVSENRFEATEVILFSGGLDSFAGALDALTNRGGNVVLVTHRSASKAVPRQNELGEFLKQRFSGRVLHIQIQAIRRGHEARETTQRSRSLLFATLGYAVARMLGASMVSFYENAIVCQNLPISPQVIGTMATRTTHPLVLRRLEHLLHAVDDAKIPIRNRFEWLTKKDVVEKIAMQGAAGCISKAVSCTKIRVEEKERTHCGTCSQCLDRRFAILAAGLAPYDTAAHYRTEVLFGALETDLHRTMAMDWSRHGWRLADLSLEEFYQTFTSELSRVIEGYPDLTPAEALRRTHEMQRRHSVIVRSVFKAHASHLLEDALPDAALLKMFCAERLKAGEVVAVSARASKSPIDETQPAAGEARFDPDRPQVAFYRQPGRQLVEVAHLGAVSGAPASVPFALKPAFEADRDMGHNPDDCRHVATSHIACEAGTSKSAIHKNVQRCRDKFAEYYRALSDNPLPPQFLIQQKDLQGYRLDPMMRIIGHHQLPPAQRSRPPETAIPGLSGLSASCQRSGPKTP